MRYGGREKTHLPLYGLTKRGGNVKDFAAKYGVTPSTVYRRLREDNLHSVWKGNQSGGRKKYFPFKQLVRTGGNIKTHAANYNVTYHTIYVRLHEEKLYTEWRANRDKTNEKERLSYLKERYPDIKDLVDWGFNGQMMADAYDTSREEIRKILLELNLHEKWKNIMHHANQYHNDMIEKEPTKQEIKKVTEQELLEKLAEKRGKRYRADAAAAKFILSLSHRGNHDFKTFRGYFDIYFKALDTGKKIPLYELAERTSNEISAMTFHRMIKAADLEPLNTKKTRRMKKDRRDNQNQPTTFPHISHQTPRKKHPTSR
ncbi:MAG: hypothetical protein ABIA21_01410 [Candidatus Aenigmatarchaeota archaeon]